MMQNSDGFGGSELMSRRRFLSSTAWMAGALAVGAGSWVLRPDWASAAGPIKVGIATDLTGAIGYAGNANANVAKMVVHDINANGGLLLSPAYYSDICA
jgi:branched-chain amino acid transport system substrate-binding protein